MDSRNIINHYKYWETEAIKADLDSKRHNFSVLISNKFHDFNIGSVIRNANAFLAAEVIIYGRRKYDKRGTVGTHNYTNFKFVKEEDDLQQIISGKFVVGIDNVEQAKPIESYEWPDEHILLCFGQEDVGLPDEILSKCQDIVYITQYGSVRSLNVGVASGIAMYDYTSKMS